MVEHATWRHGHGKMRGTVIKTIPEQFRNDPVQPVVRIAEAGLELLVHRISAVNGKDWHFRTWFGKGAGQLWLEDTKHEHPRECQTGLDALACHRS